MRNFINDISLVSVAFKMLLVQPTEEMSKLIRVELNENVNTRDNDLKLIKEWMAKQPHFPKFDGTFYFAIHPNFLIIFY